MKHSHFVGSFSLDSGNICECCESAILWFGTFTSSFSSFCRGGQREEENVNGRKQESCELLLMSIFQSDIFNLIFVITMI